jgi:hypothetical protein
VWDPDYDATHPVIRQTADWTCSACSWAWLAQSIGAYYDEWSAVEKIGYPDSINSTYGLMDSSGSRLAASYLEVPLQWPSHYASISWQEAVDLGRAGPLLIGGIAWCHWSAVRGTDGTALYLANPAPTWFGVGDYMTADEWDRLGPWSGVWLAP